MSKTSNTANPFFAMITGPSGVGKNTIISKVRERMVPTPYYAVSCTTRERREGELEGENYYFITPERFKGLIETNSFLEYAIVHGRYYGTLIREITDKLESGISVITDIDVKGARSILESNHPLILKYRLGVFIAPPSMEELRRRLEARKTESEEEVNRRMSIAKIEMRKSCMFGYDPIINQRGREDECVDRVIGTIKGVLIMRSGTGR